MSSVSMSYVPVSREVSQPHDFPAGSENTPNYARRSGIAAKIIEAASNEWKKSPPRKSEVLQQFDSVVYSKNPAGTMRKVLDTINPYSGRSNLAFHVWASKESHRSVVA